LQDSIDAPVRTYSSGMVARLAFAVAAHLEPDVLLIDEVFAVGDNAFQRKCVRHLRSFIERGGSLVLVSHNTFQIQSTCRRGLLLEHGRCVFAGTVAETLNRYLAVQAERTTGGQGAAVSARDLDSRQPVVIDRLSVLPASGDALRTGEPVRVEVAYRSLEATAALWGFSVWTGDGWVCVTGAYEVRPSPLRSGAGTLSCSIPKLPLLNGRYLVRVAIVEADTLQALAVYGYEEMAQQLIVETPASLLHNGLSAMNQLMTVDVDWD
jgi:lipopolysaccharide transport system ATP-binding protein